MRQAAEAGNIETGKAVSSRRGSQGKEQAGRRDANAGEFGWQTGEVCWEAGGQSGSWTGRSQQPELAGGREQEEQDRQQAG